MSQLLSICFLSCKQAFKDLLSTKSICVVPMNFLQSPDSPKFIEEIYVNLDTNEVEEIGKDLTQRALFNGNWNRSSVEIIIFFPD